MRKSPILSFFETFRDRPDRFLAFLKNELGITLSWSGEWGEFKKQEEIFYSCFENPETYVRAAHSMGKTFTAGVVGNAFLICKQPSKVIYLSTKMKQAKAQSWSEFIGLYRRIRGFCLRLNPPIELPEPLTEQLTLRNDWWAVVYTGKKDQDSSSQATAGFHGANMLFVLDEATGIDDSIKEAIDGCRTSEGNHLLAQGNPVKRLGWFYEGQADPPLHRKVIPISAFESPNILAKDDKLAPFLATRQWINQVVHDYGDNSAYYQAHVLAEYPQEGEQSLIPWQAVQAAADREAEPDWNRLAIGVDVADTGNDSSVITILLGDCAIQKELQGNDLMEVTGAVIDTLKEYHTWACAVDKPGVGTGVIRRLQEQKVNVMEFYGGAAPDNKEEYQYLNDELGWDLRRRFMNGEIKIPNDDVLKQQLVGVSWTFTSAGKIKVQRPKGKSPDKYDSLKIAHWMQKTGECDPGVALAQFGRHRTREWDLGEW